MKIVSKAPCRVDLAGGPDPAGADGAGAVARTGLLKFPSVPEEEEPAVSPLHPVLSGRGVSPVSYDEWLRIEAAETSLAEKLGRGDRVKLPGRDAIWSACRPS